jgi:predicted SAM-dependent methyltransferase
MVLEHVHIDLVPTALYQISRVLAPGGFVDITVPDFDYFVQKYLNNKGKLTKTMNFHNFYNITYNLLAPEIDPKIRTHQALFTEEFLTILLVDDGFVNVETVRKAGGILTVWAFKHDGSSSTLKYDTSTERENE